MKFGSTIPVLRMFDEAATRDFYVDFLGFKIDWEHRFGENSPLYMQVSREACVLHLSGHHGDCCPGGAVRIDMQDVQAYCDVLRKKDYRHAKPGCEKTGWGTLELSVKDPSGNRLTFAERLSENS